MNQTLEGWVEHGWLRRHTGSREEVANLQGIVNRELRDAGIDQLSFDAKLGMLYNAALKLADIALRLNGYREAGERHHYRVITSLPHTLGPGWAETAVFLEVVQKLRHRADYESVGFATESEVHELRTTVTELQKAVAVLVASQGG